MFLEVFLRNGRSSTPPSDSIFHHQTNKISECEGQSFHFLSLQFEAIFQPTGFTGTGLCFRWPYSERDFFRLDRGDDAEFYAEPRWVEDGGS